jgi:transposase-like protein
MNATLKELIGLAKELPEECLGEAYAKLKEIKENADATKEMRPDVCPNCASEKIVRNGKKNGRQFYLCRSCGKAFVETAGSAIANSQSSKSVWKQVIRDTVEGISIDKTAESLDLSHPTVFHMRHKILHCLNQAIINNPRMLDGVCEADETYVLECLKGRKLPKDYYRKARKHGARASKSGLSNEYICVCTSVDSDNNCMAKSVNRAAPSHAEIEEVFGDKVSTDTVILCDGSNRYDVLEDRCTVAHAKRVNKVNGFHSFIKDRLKAARNVATIYLNRYNALFALVYGNHDSAVDIIFELMTARNNSFYDIDSVNSQSLLCL